GLANDPTSELGGIILSTGNVNNLVDTSHAVIGIEALPFGMGNLPTGSTLGPVGESMAARSTVHVMLGSQLDAVNALLYLPDGDTGFNGPGIASFPFAFGTTVVTNAANGIVGTLVL